MKTQYSDLPGFQFIYLEDSFVLSIEPSFDFTIELEAVLLPGHPLYKTPEFNEKYCYAHQSIIFPKIESVDWSRKEMDPILDLDGSTDFGNIDSFYEEDGSFYLEGEWGAVKITSSLPTIS